MSQLCDTKSNIFGLSAMLSKTEDEEHCVSNIIASLNYVNECFALVAIIESKNIDVSNQ